MRLLESKSRKRITQADDLRNKQGDKVGEAQAKVMGLAFDCAKGERVALSGKPANLSGRQQAQSAKAF
jgi:hypothetical protein